jgi:hypothetical protein
MKEVKMKIKLLIGTAVACSLALCGCPKNQVPSRGPGGAASANGRDTQAAGGEVQSYSHDARGLELEFERFLNASASDEEVVAHTLFKVFALPDASGWFERYFAKERVEQLGWDYQAEIGTFEESTTHEAKIGPVGTRFKVHCSPYHSTSPVEFAPQADAPAALRQVVIEQYDIEFVSTRDYRSSILANFIYVDGAYRYLGGGAYPFWSMPDATAQKPKP